MKNKKNINKDMKKVNDIYKTDYDIFKFSYKSALIIILGSFLVALFSIYISTLLKLNPKRTLKILTSIYVGFSYAYSQYIIERKQGFVKQFYITAIIIATLILLILSFVKL